MSEQIQLPPILQDLWNAISGAFDDIRDAVLGKIEEAKKKLEELYNSLANLSDTIADLPDAFVQKISSFFSDLGNRIDALMEGLEAKVVDPLKQHIDVAFDGFQSAIAEALGEGFSAVAQPLADFRDKLIAQIQNAVREWAKEFEQKAKSVGRSFLEFMQEKVNELGAKLADLLERLNVWQSKEFADEVKSIIGRLRSGKIDLFDFVVTLTAGPWKLVYRNILRVIFPKQPQKWEDVEESIARFIAIVADMSIFADVLSIAAEALSFGLLRDIGRIVRDIAWSLGLGWLTWQTFTVPMRHGIQIPSEWHYRKYFRTERLSVSEYRNLYEENIIDERSLRERLEIEGIPDFEINWYIERTKREKDREAVKLAPTQIARLWALGVMKEDTARSMLKKRGWDDEQIDYLLREYEIRYVEKQKEKEAELQAEHEYKTKYPSTTVLAYLYFAGRIDDAKLREILEKIGYRDEMLDFMTEYVKHRASEMKRDLTRSLLESLYRNNIIDRDTFRSELLALGYSERDADWIIADVERDRLEKYINRYKDRLIELYQDGRIDEATLRSTLKDLGYRDDEIEWEIMCAELETIPRRRTLTWSTYARAYREGIIDENTLRYKLISMGYDPHDVEIIVQLYKPKEES